MNDTNLDVHKVAALARLRLRDDEAEVLREKFSQVVSYVNLLQSVEIPTEQDLSSGEQDAVQTYRPDEPQQWDIQPTQFSRFTEDNYFKTPRVIE